MQTVTIAPVMNTFESNPMLYRKEWVDFFQQQGVVVQAYKPLQGGGAVLHDETVKSIASRLGRTPSQVCIRWNIQKGNAAIFKSNRPSRIAENIDIDFELMPHDMAALDSLTTDVAREEAHRHWEEWRNGMDAPWGSGLRPEKRTTDGPTYGGWAETN